MTIPADLTEARRNLDDMLKREPDHRRALLLQDLFAAALDGTGAIPLARSPDEARSEGVAHFASSLWHRLVAANALTPKRALAIAVRLAPCIESPAQLH